MIKNIFIGVLLIFAAVFVCFNDAIGDVKPVKAAVLGMIVTLAGWFVTYRLSRKNTETQTRNAEINKTIEQIELLLKSLSDSCSEIKIESNEDLKSIVMKVNPNKAKVSRIRSALDRLQNLDCQEEQDNLDGLFIKIRQLATDEENFKNNIRANITATNLLSIESQFVSKMKRRF